jgi:RNase P subunit RPR2
VDENKKKKVKYLKRACKECGEHLLFLINKVKKVDNVEYTIKMVECESCGFTEKYNDSKKNNKEIRRMDREISEKDKYRGNRKPRKSYA